MSDDATLSSMFPGYTPPFPVVIVIDANAGEKVTASIFEILFDSKGGEKLQTHEEVRRVLAALLQYVHSDIDLDWTKQLYLYAEYKSEQTARDAVLFAKMVHEDNIKCAVRFEQQDWRDIYCSYEVYKALDKLRCEIIDVGDAIGNYISTVENLPLIGSQFHELHQNNSLVKIIGAEEERFSSYLNSQFSKLNILG